MSGRTRSLFHFTKLEYLKAILKNGYFLPRYCAENITTFSKDGKPWAARYPMVCFCDIPLSRIQHHTESYGDYGLGLPQQWGLSNGLNPVLYLNDDSPLRKELNRLRDRFLNAHADERQKEHHEFFSLLAYVKSLNGHTLRGEPREFYLESEWRYIPSGLAGTGYVAVSPLGIALGAADKLKDHPLRFDAKDIRYIFVEKRDEIPDLVRFIDAELEQHSEDERKILHSRLVSLQELRHDI